MVNITVSKVLGIIFVLVGLGLLLGLGWVDSDWAHPIASMAEYRDNAWKSEIDREEYQKLQAAHTQAEIQKLQDEREHQRQLQAEELRRIRAEHALVEQLAQLAGVVAIGVAGLSFLALCIGFSVYIARRPVALRQEIWTEADKRQVIEAARRREREEREAALRSRLQPDIAIQERWREMFSEPIGSNGGEDAAMRFQ